RVTRPRGAIAACVWDHGGGTGPLSAFWRAARELDPGVADESDLPGSRRGQLEQLFQAAGLADVHGTYLVADLAMSDFETWWAPFEQGVGPAGLYVDRLDANARAALQDRCRRQLGNGEFVITARAWAARGAARTCP
ncbi:MAG: SAM-dependent methyltransferase, partial [Chloroflexota bacterium]